MTTTSNVGLAIAATLAAHAEGSTCADCRERNIVVVTCDDAKTRCCACTVKAAFCVKCGRAAPWGVCDICKAIGDARNECISNECAHVEAGQPAAWVVRLAGLDDFVCESCYQMHYNQNAACTVAWEAESLDKPAEETRVQSAPRVSSTACPFCSDQHLVGKCPHAAGGGPWERIANLEAANIALQYQIVAQAETAGYAYELLNSLLTGTMRVSTHRNSIKRAMAKLIGGKG